MGPEVDLLARLNKAVNAFDQFDSSDLRVAVGKVNDYVYHRGYYKIAGPGGRGEDIAAIELGALRADGQTNKESIPIGSYVFYIFLPSFSVGYIIGSFSGARDGDPSAPRKSVKYPAAGGIDKTKFDDPNIPNPHLFEPTNDDGTPHRIMGGDHVPMDIVASAFARTNPSGGAVVLDNHFFLAQVRESVGVLALEDGTCQLSGEQIFIRSFLKEYQEFKNKYGMDGVEDVFLSVANGLGYANSAALAEVAAKEESNPDDVDVVGPNRVPLPFSTKLTGETAEGYSTVVRTYSGEDRDTGVPLFRETVYRDGSLIVQSASQIFIEKFCLIEDPLSRKDTVVEDDKKVRPIEFEHNTETTSICGIAALHNQYLSYLLGTKIPYHQKRFWNVNDTKKIAQTLGISGRIVGGNQRSLPQYVNLLVDLEKNVNRKIYRSRSGIYLTDDGSILIKDGYGSSITMGRGNITVSPAKDLMLQVGQDMVGIIGGEVNQVSMKGVTISSEQGGLSLNSSGPMNIRSTDSTSGILIESLSAKSDKDILGKPVGVVVRANNGVVSTIAKNIESRSNSELHSSSNFDLNVVRASIYFSSSLKFIGQEMAVPITDSTNGVFLDTASAVFNCNTTIKQPLFAMGSITIDGSITMTGGLTSLGMGSFAAQPSALPQRTIDQLTKTYEKLFKSLNTNFSASTRFNEKIRLTEKPRLTALYIDVANAVNPVFKTASTKKVPYEFTQAEWQNYSEQTLDVKPEEYSGAPLMLIGDGRTDGTNGIFWLVPNTRVEDTGAYKEDTEQVKETELVKSTVFKDFKINVSSEYKNSPYEKE
jgi:hypothetical protein